MQRSPSGAYITMRDCAAKGDDDPNPCTMCGATVAGNDAVNGMCQIIDFIGRPVGDWITRGTIENANRQHKPPQGTFLMVDTKIAEWSRPSLVQIAPADPAHSFVKTSNRMLKWNIDAHGGAYLDEAGVDRVDRMVALIIQISNDWCPDPQDAAMKLLND